MVESTSQVLSNYDSSDLLVLIGYRNDNPDEAEAAFEELYRRNYEYVFNLAYASMKQLDLQDQTTEYAEDLSQDVWKEIWEGLGDSFMEDSDTASDPNTSVKKWLAAVVRNRVKRCLAETVERRETYDGFKEIPLIAVTSHDDDFNLTSTPKYERVEQALNSLDPVDKEILLISFEFDLLDNDGVRRRRITKDIRNTLINKHGLSPASLRKRKQRALEKLRKALS
jgi:RNA polymerase sigma factor (sigma-70 family)